MGRRIEFACVVVLAAIPGVIVSTLLSHGVGTAHCQEDEKAVENAQKAEEVVRVRRLELVDENGTVLAFLGPKEHSFGLHIYSAKAKSRIFLGLSRHNEGGLYFNREDGGHRISIVEGGDLLGDVSEISIYGPQGYKRFHALSDKDEGCQLELFGKKEADKQNKVVWRAP